MRTVFALIGGLITIGFIVLLIGFSNHLCDELEKVQQEAVQRGCAEYNPTNGVWHWKDK